MTLFSVVNGKAFPEEKKKSAIEAASFSPSGATRPSLAFLYVFAFLVSEHSLFKFIGCVTLRRWGLGRLCEWVVANCVEASFHSPF